MLQSISYKHRESNDAPKYICKCKTRDPMECPECKSDEECNTEISSADPSRYFYLLIFMAFLYLVFSPEEVPNELKRKGEITHKKLSNMLIVSSLYEKYAPRYEYLEIEKTIKPVTCDLIRSGDPCAPAHSDNAQKAKSLIIKKKIK